MSTPSIANTILGCGHPVVRCAECEGTGWTCATCGQNGAHCVCADEQEAMDCQHCQGTGHEDCETCDPDVSAGLPVSPE